MTKQDDEEKQNVRMMWMATGAIVLFIVLMGLSMLGMLGNQSGTAPTDMSSQSRTLPTN